MSKQSFSLHLDTFRDNAYDNFHQSPQHHSRSFFSSRKPHLSNRYSFQQESLPAKDYRPISKTHRDNIKQQPYNSDHQYKTSRHNPSHKPSIAYIDSEQNPVDFMSSLDEHINHLKVEGGEKYQQRSREKYRDRERQREKQNAKSYRVRKSEAYLKLEEEYKKQRIDNALLAKKIETKRKDLQANDKVLMEMEHKLNNLIRQAEKLKFQNKQQEAKNSQLKEMIVKKDEKNRVEENTRLHFRHSSSIFDLEKERDQFEKKILSNNSKFYK